MVKIGVPVRVTNWNGRFLYGSNKIVSNKEMLWFLNCWRSLMCLLSSFVAVP